MELTEMPLSQLSENVSNPRTITDTKLERLVESILVFPRMLSLRPIVVDENNVILGGNMRFRALSRISSMKFPSAIFAEKQESNGNRVHHKIRYKHLGPVIIKGTKEQDNIAWDKWPEDYPFTNGNKLYVHKGD